MYSISLVVGHKKMEEEIISDVPVCISRGRVLDCGLWGANLSTIIYV